jgi:hypothetical protein
MSGAGHWHGPARRPGRSAGDAHPEHNPECKYRSQYQDNAEPFLLRVPIPDLDNSFHQSVAFGHEVSPRFLPLGNSDFQVILDALGGRFCVRQFDAHFGHDLPCGLGVLDNDLFQRPGTDGYVVDKVVKG